MDSATAIKVFISAIALTGAIRFIMSVSGLPDYQVKYASMSFFMAVGAAYFAIAAATWKKRLCAAYLLILPYMLVEVSALGYEWATGRHTIFHAPEYSFRTTLPLHFWGHLIGGLTWEPVILFILMEIIHGLYAGTRRLLAH